MGSIEKSLEVYEKLRMHKYRITVENGVSFILDFKKKRYHHLAGFQHLKDKPHLSTLVKDKTAFYNALSIKGITEQEVVSSQKFALIEERFRFFDQLLSIMAEGEGRIIIDYDQSKTKGSEIKAKFMLYKRNGTPFKEEFRCFSLFIGYDPRTEEYYPATYIVEHSNKYTNDQTPLLCTIEVIKPPKKKNKPVKKAK